MPSSRNETATVRTRTAEDYLEKIQPDILKSFSEEQLGAVKSALESAIGKPSPKIIDLRLTIDLIISRFYLVLLVGKDRRRTARPYPTTPLTKIANIAVAVILLIGLNLTLSAFVFLTAYLLKSALGVDLTPSNLQEMIQGK